MKRRKLSDLYVKGREIAVSDGDGDEVKVWLAKLNEVDRETAIRRANAAKARFLIDSDDEEGDRFAAVYADMRDITDRDDLVAFIITEDVSKARQRIEAQHALDEETWNKEDYLQGLLDAWIGDKENPGLESVQAEDPDDPEVKRVWAELVRFQEEINVEVRAEADALVKDHENVDIDTLRRKATHCLLETQSAEEFAREFRRQQLFFAVRDPVNRRMRYFEKVAELDDLDDELRAYLYEQYEALMVDRIEGKDSPPPADSSTSSESEDQDSGLKAVSA